MHGRELRISWSDIAVVLIVGVRSSVVDAVGVGARPLHVVELARHGAPCAAIAMVCGIIWRGWLNQSRMT